MIPGGFSYGDYLRCGAIARFSPVMRSVAEEAQKGRPVLGICNGFQILCEAGLLPGALVRNQSLHFICEHIHVRVEQATSGFTKAASAGAVLRIPIAHGEGNYVADAPTLAELNPNGRVLLRYCTAAGETRGGKSQRLRREYCGICNRAGNVFGLMPHPERACDARLGSVDGRVIFESILGR